MKSLKTLFANFLLLVNYQVFAQNIFIADNNFNAPTGPNVFPTVQEAVDAASAGDIVHVQPSPNTYSNVSIDKQITLLGIGFNLDKDFPLQSTMGSITLTNNIDNTSDASGTVISGLETGAIFLGFLTGATFTLQDLVIENCLSSNIRNLNGYADIDNLEIRNCQMKSFFFLSGIGNLSIGFQRPITNSVIRNCLLFNAIGILSGTPGTNTIANNILYTAIRVEAEGTNTMILNNVFVGDQSVTNSFSAVLRDCIVSNNIFHGRTPSIAAAGGSTDALFQRNTFTNNLTYNTGNDELPPSGGGASNTGSGNLVGISPIFVDVPVINSWDPSRDFTLQAGSPAINAGTDGTDIGISGGPFPFTLNFTLETSPIPVIKVLNTSSVINPGDDLNVEITAVGN